MAVRISGLQELNRALRNMEGDLSKDLRKALKEAAEPVARDARHKAERFGPPTAGGIAAGTSRGGAVVRQRRRKTTGKRPDFGALQMRTVLVPALKEHEGDIEKEVERMLDSLANRNGF